MKLYIGVDWLVQKLEESKIFHWANVGYKVWCSTWEEQEETWSRKLKKKKIKENGQGTWTEKSIIQLRCPHYELLSIPRILFWGSWMDFGGLNHYHWRQLWVRTHMYLLEMPSPQRSPEQAGPSAPEGRCEPFLRLLWYRLMGQPLDSAVWKQEWSDAMWIYMLFTLSLENLWDD